MADPFRTAISGRARIAKARTGKATTLAVRSGAEMPRNCGTSSPNTMENTVTSSSAVAVATGSTAWGGTTRSTGAVSSRPTDGCARYPTTRVVKVIPTWAADSWVADWRNERSTPEPARPVDGLLDRGPVQGHERELHRHEDRCSHGEQHRGKHEQPFAHSVDHPSVRGRRYPSAG